VAVSRDACVGEEDAPFARLRFVLLGAGSAGGGGGLFGPYEPPALPPACTCPACDILTQVEIFKDILEGESVQLLGDGGLEKLRRRESKWRWWHASIKRIHVEHAPYT
jgi:hypothetical protein